MVKDSISYYLNRFRRSSLILAPSPQQEEAVSLFYQGRYDDALSALKDLLQAEELVEIDAIQGLILGSHVLIEKGDHQEGLKQSIQTISRSKEIDHPLLIIDSLFKELPFRSKTSLLSMPGFLDSGKISQILLSFKFK